MKVTGASLIALAILIGSVIFALGGRYQLTAPSTLNNDVWRVDRLTGDVQICRETPVETDEIYIPGVDELQQTCRSGRQLKTRPTPGTGGSLDDKK